MVTEVSFCWSRRSALGKCAEHAISQLHAAASRGAEKCDRWSSPRPISTAQLKRLPVLHLRPINQLVSLGSYLVNPVGDLVLRWASYLDAFSTYPIRTSLPGTSIGMTTGTPEVRSARPTLTED